MMNKLLTQHSLITSHIPRESLVRSTRIFSLYIFILIATILYLGYRHRQSQSRIRKITESIPEQAHHLFTKRDIVRIIRHIPERDFVHAVDTIMKLLYKKRQQISALFITAPQLISKRLHSLPTSLQLTQQSTQAKKLKRYLDVMFPFFARLDPDHKDRLIHDIIHSIRTTTDATAERFRDIIYDKVSSDIVEYLRHRPPPPSSSPSVSTLFSRKKPVSSLLRREISSIKDDVVSVSIGFEFETIRGCFVKLDALKTISYQRKRQVHMSGMPVQLTDKVSITGDYIAPQNRVSTIVPHIRSYKGTLNQSEESFSLQFQDSDKKKYTYRIPTQSCDLNKFFGSLEWIVTFRDFQETRIEDVDSFMIKKCNEAVSLIEEEFKRRYREIHIRAPDNFPVTKGFFDPHTETLLLLYPTTYFGRYSYNLTYTDLEYDPQCTFGVTNLTDMYKLILYLFSMTEHFWKTRNKVFLDAVLPALEIQQECHAELNTNPEWGLYLFFFVYSFLTRKDRKKQMTFMFRFTFSSMWPRILGGLIGRDTIERALMTHRTSIRHILDSYEKSYRDVYGQDERLNDFDSLMTYYNTVHTTQEADRFAIQLHEKMQDTTYFQTGNGLYLFEFRMFQQLFFPHRHVIKA